MSPAAREAPKLELAPAVAPAALAAAVAAVPEAAYAGNSGYALLQLGWAIFIISLGPAVLFWRSVSNRKRAETRLLAGFLKPTESPKARVQVTLTVSWRC